MEQLPNELKDLIWGLLTPRRRLIRIRAIDTERDVLSPPFVWRSTIPAVFHICPASRNKALNLYPFEEHFANCKPEFEAGPRWKRLARPALASFEKNNDILVISWQYLKVYKKREFAIAFTQPKQSTNIGDRLYIRVDETARPKDYIAGYQSIPNTSRVIADRPLVQKRLHNLRSC